MDLLSPLDKSGFKHSVGYCLHQSKKQNKSFSLTNISQRNLFHTRPVCKFFITLKNA